jgi:hypothetical protein
MKDMIWRPDPERDAKVNAYLDHINRAPYAVISLIMFGLFCLFTLVVILGVF